MKNNINFARKPSRGVTLVEIAIVLVIIGLLLGGILKGQELINNAKVRSIADRQNSLKVAWFAFIDRYQALPGDFIGAAQFIPGAGLEADVTSGTIRPGDGKINVNESPIVLQHLTGTGYLRCPQCTATDVAANPSAQNSLQNSYGGVMGIWHTKSTYAGFGGNVSERLFIQTGPRIPSNIISEVDRKLDDGTANTGDFVFSIADFTTSNFPTVITCTTDSAVAQTATGTLIQVAPLYWRHATASQPIEQNCGAAVSI